MSKKEVTKVTEVFVCESVWVWGIHSQTRLEDVEKRAQAGRKVCVQQRGNMRQFCVLEVGRAEGGFIFLGVIRKWQIIISWLAVERFYRRAVASVRNQESVTNSVRRSKIDFPVDHHRGQKVKGTNKHPLIVFVGNGLMHFRDTSLKAGYDLQLTRIEMDLN